MPVSNNIQTRYQWLHTDVVDIATEHLEHRGTVGEPGKSPNHSNTPNTYPYLSTPRKERIKPLPQSYNSPRGSHEQYLWINMDDQSWQ